MIVINIILFLILSALIINVVNYKRKLVIVNEQNKEENYRLEKLGLELIDKKNKLQLEENNIKENIKLLDASLDARCNEFQIVTKHIENAQIQAQNISRTALENYIEMLESSYIASEKEFDSKIEDLAKTYLKVESEYISKIETEHQELKKLKETRKAIIEAQRREEEIKLQIDNYRLKINTRDSKDIQLLEEVKKNMSNPRALSMLIWSTYFQKDMNTLCNRLLGLNIVTGIYKITNLNNGKCYIGQSVDVAKRWKDHAKCGLGIDAPITNKLYKEMQEQGIWNFTWELLEACPREQLNEKEKYYIDLYQSKEYGYNSTKGNN